MGNYNSSFHLENQLNDSNKQVTKLTNQLNDSNNKVTQLTNQLIDSIIKYLN